MNQARMIDVIVAAIGEGAQETGCKDGPGALSARGIDLALRERGLRAALGATVASHAAAGAAKLGIVEEFMPRLAAAVRASVAANRFPLVLGGDHSCAVGTWSAIADARRALGPVGLIWVDAHLDSHTPGTSPSQAPHGMPLAALLGHGSPGLTDLFGWRGKLDARHVVLIGARSFEAEELGLLRTLGVHVMPVGEVHARGMAACLADAVEVVGHGTAGYGLTFDVDALDPLDAPGVGSPEDGGIRLVDALEGLAQIAADPRLLGLELVEYNPHLDDAAATTARACEALITAALVPGAAGTCREPGAHGSAPRAVHGPVLAARPGRAASTGPLTGRRRARAAA
jgi:arginase